MSGGLLRCSNVGARSALLALLVCAVACSACVRWSVPPSASGFGALAMASEPETVEGHCADPSGCDDDPNAAPGPNHKKRNTSFKEFIFLFGLGAVIIAGIWIVPPWFED